MITKKKCAWTVPSTIHFLISIMNQWGMRWQEPAKMGGMKAIGVKIYGITIEKNKS